MLLGRALWSLGVISAQDTLEYSEFWDSCCLQPSVMTGKFSLPSGTSSPKVFGHSHGWGHGSIISTPPITSSSPQER